MRGVARDPPFHVPFYWPILQPIDGISHLHRHRCNFLCAYYLVRTTHLLLLQLINGITFIGEGVMVDNQFI